MGAAAWNGGGCGKKEASGGGASDIRTVKGAWNDDASLNSRILVAGGGGGSSKSASEVHDNSEDGGYGGGGIGDGPDGRHSYGGNAPGYDTKLQMQGLGGGQKGGKNRGKPSGVSVTCNQVLGGGPLKGGGGYYAGCSTFCDTKHSNTKYQATVKSDSSPYKFKNHCGGGGGGSSYISKIFTNPGGQSGVRRSDGKVRICVVSKGGTVSHTMKFPQAKYGELSFTDAICPYNIVSPTKNANIADYYTLSTFRAADGSIIDNRPAIRCGVAGQWETNTDGSIKMIYECKELNKCKQPFTVNNDVDWGDYDFEVTNTAIVEDITGKNRMQCMVDKEGNANWYKVN